MKTISVVCCLLHAIWTLGESISVEGFESGEVSFPCSHKLAWQNDKYLCKHPCKAHKDKLATVQSGQTVRSGRMTLKDSGKGDFTVTFRQLQLSDSGMYWCGVDRTGFDTFTEVHINVKKVTGAEASAVLEVSGHVDGEISIRCSGNWTTNGSSGLYHMYFCKEFCSGENIVIQTEGDRPTVTQRGRYKMAVDRRDGSVNVTIEGLERADAGTYHCGVGKTFIVMYQEVNLIVLGASTVPPGSASSTTSTQTEAVNTLLLHNSSTSSATLSATLPPAGEKTNQEEAATKLTDTTVVIIVSVSLALLVCAIIPLIFYAHCRSNPERQTDEAMKGEADCCDGAFAQDAVRLQPLQKDADAESSGEDASQYAAIYQALDPQSLD